MKNRLTELFSTKKSDILNVYFTAGHPHLNDTVPIIECLDRLGVDLIEVGIPYSDPMADGETIQNSSSKALKNGMTLSILFDQIRKVRKSTEIPLVLMGYFNQMLQYGVEAFVKNCALTGVDGLIIPDLPMDIYEKEFKTLFEKYNLSISFLITPETSDERIIQADRLSTGFIYIVSKSSITGTSSDISDTQMQYFNRIKSLHLKSPNLIGFGIHDQVTYQAACDFSNGAIIGSAFIRALDNGRELNDSIATFIKAIR